MEMKKKLTDVCFMFICLLTIFAVIGTAKSFALGETSRDDYQIAPGVTESTVYVTVDAGYNVRVHILRISSDSGIGFKASYGDYYGDMNTYDERSDRADYWDEEDWMFRSVRNQAQAYAESADAGYEVIAASNGDFFDVESGEPEGSLVIEGNLLKRNNKRPFFAVLNNGKVVIRRAGGRLGDTKEVISGKTMLLWKGRVTSETDNLRNPREAIGICQEGTVIIVSVDGREPASAGVTLQELADIMKAQGCRYALNLDGGGSVSFMTKRADDEELLFRSNHSDGPERNVGPALLVVRKADNAAALSDAQIEKEYAAEMKSSDTRLWKDSKDIYHYRINGKGQTGFFAISGESYLFSKGKGVTSTIRIGKTTYRFIRGKLDSTSDANAGNVIIGYCGAGGQKGKNLIYAYHDGDKRLNIGVNPLTDTADGRMKTWTHDTVLEIPWYAVRADITKIYIGNGVINLGDYFLYSTRGQMTGGAAAPVCRLTSIRLPSSMKTIGAYSLYNKPALKNITIPAKAKTIGKYAFAYSGTGTVRFRGNTPPSFKRSSMKKTGFRTVYVRKSKAWKKFVKQRRFRTYGYKRTVKYK